MSSQPPPDPITTGFNPEAWEEPTGLLSKLRRLFQSYVTYPIAQSYPITFSNMVFATDATLTKMANTSYVFANLVAYLASLPPLLTSTTWLAIQNFTGIETNDVNPIGGILTIGTGVDHDIRIASQNSRSVVLHLGDGDSATSGAGIHINNGLNSEGNVEILHGTGSTGTIFLGTRRTTPSVSTTITTLNCPLTPTYSYPVGTATPPNTPSVGIAGTIGYILPTTWITNATISGSVGKSVRSVSLTTGVWIIAGTTRTASGTAGSNSLQFTGLPDSIAGVSYGKKGTWQYTSGQPTLPWGQATIITLGVTTTTTLYLTQRNDSVAPLDYSDMVCIKIA